MSCTQKKIIILKITVIIGIKIFHLYLKEVQMQLNLFKYIVNFHKDFLLRRTAIKKKYFQNCQKNNRSKNTQNDNF